MNHLGAFDINNPGDRLYPFLVRKLSSRDTAVFGVTAKEMAEFSTRALSDLRAGESVIVGGGDLITPQKLFLEFFGVQSWPAHLAYGFVLKWPAVYLSVGVPFETYQPRDAKFLWARDYRAALNLKGRPADVVAPDLAVLTAEIFPAGVATKPTALVQTAYPNRETAAPLTRLAKTHDVRLASITRYNGDAAVMQSLADELGMPLIELTTVADFVAAVSSSALVVASSMHANILAFSYGIPHLIAPTPAMNKIPGFLEIVGLPQHLALKSWAELEADRPIVDNDLRTRAKRLTREAFSMGMAAFNA